MERRRRGGQWSALDPELSKPMQDIVRLLRNLVDGSGLRLKGVQQRLLEQHREGPRPPSYDVLSRRLRGEGLQNNAWLINAIIEALAEPEHRNVLAEEVRQHLLDARAARASSRGQAPQESHQETESPELLEVLRENRELNKVTQRLERRLARKDRELLILREQLEAVSHRPATPRHAAGPLQAVRDVRGQVPGSDSPAVGSRPVPETDSVHSAPSSSPSDVLAVADALRDVRGFEAVTANALRDAFDAVLDGARTGRFDVATLGTTEKVYIATKIIHMLREAWGLPPGSGTGLTIGNRRVTLKVTLGRTWVIAPDDVGTVCLLVTADDQRSRWSLGLIRIEPEHLIREVSNRDRKRMLSAAGRRAALWIFQDAPLPENTLLHLPEDLRESVIASATSGGSSSSSSRIAGLFKLVQGRLINHTALRTIAMRQDAGRRVREAQNAVRREGILVLSSMGAGPEIARSLGLPEPRTGEWVSQRITRLRPGHAESPSVTLSGEEWTVAGPDDPVEAIPDLYAGR
ncbi:NaeI family type II restriction endonuclease [Streptomyces goshikiensis]|uniref:NaeI family type II restriction endonuclease n=1 Tax=Streptomyces goshikiensis TaxID=1942 RepID=UPI0036FEEBCC